MTDLRSRVTVVVPVYNNAAILPRALSSLAAQDYLNFHVVVVDDCSTDDSVAVAQTFAAKYPFVRVEKNERNLGAVGNYSAAYRFIEGEYCMIGGPDDSWAPTFLSAMVTALEDHPAAVMALSSVNSLYDDGESEIYRWPEIKGPPHDNLMRQVYNTVYGVTREGKTLSPYYSFVQGLVRSRCFKDIYLNNPLFWYVEVQLVVMCSLMGGLVTVDEVLYTRHRERLTWAERYPTDNLTIMAQRPIARLVSSFLFLWHALTCKQLSVGRKFCVPWVFVYVFLFQVVRPAIVPLLRKSAISGAVDSIKRITYKHF